MENKKIKILAIDDNRDNLITLKAIISEVIPHSVVYTEVSGQRGIESARNNDPDMILLDIVMPGMDGYQVCKILKADEHLSETPIVFLTALKGDKHSRILALEAGGDAFLAKPIDTSELKAQILAMLKIKEAVAYKRNEKIHLEELVQKRTEELKKANIATLNLLEDLHEENQQRKKSEAALRVSERQYAFLAGTAFDLVKITSIQKIYEYTVRKLFELLEDKGIVAIVEYDTDSNHWKMQHIEGIHDKLDELVGIFGFDVRKLEGDISTKYYDKIISGKLVEIEWNFQDFFNNKISDIIGKTVKKLLSIDKIYCILVHESEKIFGNITLIMKKNAKPLNADLIEAFVMQVTNFIKKLKSELELKESERKITSLISNLQGMVYSCDNDKNWTMRYVSQGCLELTGYKPDELLKNSVISYNDLIYPEDVDYVWNTVQVAVKSKKEYTLEYRITDKNGKVKWVCERGQGVFYENGELSALEGIINDISVRMQAEEKLKLLNRSVEASSVSVIITDAGGHISYVNPYFTKLTGYSSDEVNGRILRILSPEKLSEAEGDGLWRAILSGKDWTGEYQNRKKNGELYWEYVVISPVLDSKGKIINFVAIKEDITAKKKMLEELVAAKEKAEESDKLKSAFLANMSHEIRTPMNGILGFAELLKEPDLSGEQQKYFISIIEKSGARMLNIINDIVDISKIESGQMKLEKKETNINEQLDYIYNFFKPEVEAKGIQFSYNSTLPLNEVNLTTDSEKIYAVLINLVKNAIKYTIEGSIEFGYNVKIMPNTDNTGIERLLEFYVKDTGIGIPKDREKAIFERFIQADIADKMARQGAGLGLAISKAYIEMLGGKIWVESESGKGSTFYFTIPFIPDTLNNINRRIESIKQTENIEIENLKILIVEDDESSKELLSLEIGVCCREILFAGTGSEAIKICRANPDIDLIFMDIQMPEMSGYEAVQQIRQFNTGVLIIALTAFALNGDKEKALEAGCTGYISKPVTKSELFELIQKCFNR